jgi:copper chaperone CopZ
MKSTRSVKKKLFALFLLTAVTVGTTTLEAQNNHKHNHKNHNHKNEHRLENSKKALLEIPTHNPIIKVKVDGIVCSFCAYGVEKKLSKLPFVETNAFGGDGVLVDLKNGFVSVTLKDAKQVNFREIVKVITKGGYVAKEIHFKLNGTVQKKGRHRVIQDSEFPYHFILKESNGKLEKNSVGNSIDVNVFFKVRKKFKDKKEIRVIVKEIDTL